MRLPFVLRSRRPRIAFSHDVVMAAVSFPLSLLLRLGDQFYHYDTVFVLQGAALFAGVAAAVFLSMRLYRASGAMPRSTTWWRSSRRSRSPS